MAIFQCRRCGKIKTIQPYKCSSTKVGLCALCPKDFPVVEQKAVVVEDRRPTLRLKTLVK